MAYVPLLDRVFAFYEEEPTLEGGSRWSYVDDMTLRDLGWATPKDRRMLGVTLIVRHLSQLPVGKAYINDLELGGRTKFTRKL